MTSRVPLVSFRHHDPEIDRSKAMPLGGSKIRILKSIVLLFSTALAPTTSSPPTYLMLVD
eukprot:EC690400.1.p3 GENE.EC690400.1~~EC690400.1.p3  ORF type:complete len:60 (-),score=1.00 EC690400.1:182-361(-)